MAAHVSDFTTNKPQLCMKAKPRDSCSTRSYLMRTRRPALQRMRQDLTQSAWSHAACECVSDATGCAEHGVTTRLRACAFSSDTQSQQQHEPRHLGYSDGGESRLDSHIQDRQRRERETASAGRMSNNEPGFAQ